MKRYIQIMSFLLVLFCTTLSHANTYTDNFNRADGDLGANWTEFPGFNPLTISGNKVVSDDSQRSSYWSNNTFSNDQYAQITAVTLDSGANTSVYVRCSTDVFTGYFLNVSSSTWNIYKIVDGNPTQIVNDQSRATSDGTTVRLTIVGSTLSISFDGNVEYQYTDTETPIPGGHPGISLRGTTATADNWVCGDMPKLSFIGIYRNGEWYLDLNGNGAWDDTPTDAKYFFGGGVANTIPVTGDWTGTGTTNIGIYTDGTWYLDLNGNGAWDGSPTDTLYSFGNGVVNAIPVTGDWTGDGKTKIGIYADGTWYLDLNGNGVWDGTPTDALYSFGNGIANAIPVTGDWTGDGKTKIGIYVNGVWYLDLNGNGVWDGTPTDGMYSFGGGVPNALPVTGDWTGDGKTKIGIFADGGKDHGVWYLDLNGNGIWDGTSTDGMYNNFGGGVTGAVPVTGAW